MLGLSGQRGRNIALASVLFLSVIFLLLPKLLASRVHQQFDQALKSFNQQIVQHGPQHAIQAKGYKQGWFQSAVTLSAVDGSWQRVLTIHHGPVAYSKKISWCLAQAEAKAAVDGQTIAFFMTFDFHQHFRLWVSDRFDQNAAHMRAAQYAMGGYQFTLEAGLAPAGHTMAEPMRMHLTVQDLRGQLPHHQSFLVKQIDWQADVTPVAADVNAHASHLPPALGGHQASEDFRVDTSASFQGVQALLDVGGVEHLPMHFDIQQMGFKHVMLPSVREWLVFGGQIALQRQPDWQQVMRLINGLFDRTTLITLDGLKAESHDAHMKGVYTARWTLDGSTLPEDHTFADIILLLKSSLDVEAVGVQKRVNQKTVLQLDQFKLHMARDLAQHDFSLDLKGLNHVVGVHQNDMRLGGFHLSGTAQPAAHGLIGVDSMLSVDALCVKKDCLRDLHVTIKGEGVRNEYSEERYPKFKALVGQLLGIVVREVEEQQAVEKRRQMHPQRVAVWRPNAGAAQPTKRTQKAIDRENQRVSSVRRQLQAQRIRQWRALLNQISALRYDANTRYVFDGKAQGTLFDAGLKGFYRPVYRLSVQPSSAEQGSSRADQLVAGPLSGWFNRGLRLEGVLTVKPQMAGLKQFFERLLQVHFATVDQHGRYTLPFKVAAKGFLLNGRLFMPDDFDKAVAPEKPVLSSPVK